MSAVIKADQADRFLLMVSYSPTRMPKRGADGYTDLVSPKVLEETAWGWLGKGGKLGLFHEDGHEAAARCVESSIHRGPDWVIKGPDGTPQTIREGDWLIGAILSPAAWRMYKQGLIAGASPQGRARRRPASRESLARLRS
jgi:hypothetical protein